MKIKETELQKGVHKLLSDPSKIYSTFSGKRLQVLSIGSINKFAGPDFTDVALLIDGHIIVGDAEFHRKTSDWLLHNHESDPEYARTILHIVFEHNKQIENHPEILVLDEQLILKEYHKANAQLPEIKPDSIEDLQNYALIRLLRKSSEAQKLLNTGTLTQAYIEYTKQYIKRFTEHRRRPSYTPEKISELLNSLKNWEAIRFLEQIGKDNSEIINDQLQKLIKKQFSIEGSHLRREIVLNSILPLAVCLADDDARINIFLWYWSTPALNTYGMLTRRFPEIPQNYLWQQQGMLEYLKEFGNKQTHIKEMIEVYGFASVLNFYKLGKAPFLEK